MVIEREKVLEFIDVGAQANNLVWRYPAIIEVEQSINIQEINKIEMNEL